MSELIRAAAEKWITHPTERCWQQENVIDQSVTVFTVGGTGSRPRTGSNNFCAMVAGRLDTGRYTWRPIRYPAAVPLRSSANKGIGKLISAINATSGKFVLIGQSQGAIVTSLVYREIRRGSLTARDRDLLAGVAFGNPCREPGHTFPGCPDPGGHGIANSQNRLVSTDTRWWDFAVPGDAAACVEDDLAGSYETALFELLWDHSLYGFFDAVLDTIEGAPDTLRPLALDIWAYIRNSPLGGVLGSGVSPHGRYATYAPLPGNPKTCVELATDYLNLVAVA